MKMSHQLFLPIYLISALFTSCMFHSKKMPDDNAIVIDLTAPCDSTCYLSDLADSIVYYPIVTPTIKFVDIEVLTKYIYAYANRKLYVYERNNNRLIKSFNFGPVIGGPGYEPYYYKYANTAFPFEQEELFVCSRRVEKGTNVFYSSAVLNVMTEEWGEPLHFPGYDYVRINDYIVKKNTEPIAITKKDTLTWFDNQMKCLKKEPLKDIALRFPYPGPWLRFNLLHDKIYYHVPTSRTVYEVSPIHAPIPLYRFELGKYKSSFKEFADFVLETPEPYYKIKKFNASPYYHLRGSQMSDHYVWGAYNYKGDIYAVLFDREKLRTMIYPARTSNVFYPIEEGGIPNDLDGGLDFWPKRISKYGEIYSWYNVKDLKEKVSQSHSGAMKNPEAAKRLKELLDNLPEEVNVIVAVLKEKSK